MWGQINNPHIMTVTERLHKMLTERGMFDSQASAVLDIAIPELKKSMNINYDYEINFDGSGDYSEITFNLMFVNIKPIALKWIDHKG